MSLVRLWRLFGKFGRGVDECLFDRSSASMTRRSAGYRELRVCNAWGAAAAWDVSEHGPAPARPSKYEVSSMPGLGSVPGL